MIRHIVRRTSSCDVVSEAGSEAAATALACAALGIAALDWDYTLATYDDTTHMVADRGDCIAVTFHQRTSEQRVLVGSGEGVEGG